MKANTIMIGAALLAGAAFADKVTLKSGSFLTGEAGLIQEGKLLFKSDDLGDLKIDIANIKSLDAAKNHVVQYKDNTTEEKILDIRDGELYDGKGKLAMENVKATDPAAETWHGNVNIAYNASRGNTYQDSAAVVANVNRRWEKDRLNVDFGYYYGKQGQSGEEEKKNEDRWEVEAKHDHFWWPKVYHYEDLKWERDMIQDLNARYRVGLGGGYQWLENAVFESTGKWNFNQELGVNWIKEDYDNNDDAKDNGFCALRYGHHFGYIPKWSDGVEVFHEFEILPEVDEWEKFLAKANVGVSANLIWNFNLLAKIEWEYNSKPANDRKKDDTRFIVGLGYKW
ncbi:MAG: DUF481 domain-containing protein [bacterium]|nr:DUF481 domain-containing protein [Candidatus Colisoma equi]